MADWIERACGGRRGMQHTLTRVDWTISWLGGCSLVCLMEGY